MVPTNRLVGKHQRPKRSPGKGFAGATRVYFFIEETDLRSGDRDRLVQIDVLNRVQQGDAVLHGLLEGLAS